MGQLSDFFGQAYGLIRDWVGQAFDVDGSLWRNDAVLGKMAMQRVDRLSALADVQKQNSSNPEDWATRVADAHDAPRAVQEYLETLDDEVFGAATTTQPKFTAHADPASLWAAARKGSAFFAYSTNYLIDTDHSIIDDVDANLSNRTAEAGAMRKMIDRTEERFGLKPDWSAANTAFGSSDNLVWLALKRKILPFIPESDKGERTDGTFSRSDFTWGDENDRNICAGGKEVKHTRRTYSDPARNAPSWRSREYRALKVGSIACLLKAKYCPNTEARAIHREKYEIVREFVRQCTVSDFSQIASDRRKKVEMLLAHLKRILGLARFRLRGPYGVQAEFFLAAITQDFRKLARLKPMVPATG